MGDRRWTPPSSVRRGRTSPRAGRVPGPANPLLPARWAVTVAALVALLAGAGALSGGLLGGGQPGTGLNREATGTGPLSLEAHPGPPSQNGTSSATSCSVLLPNATLDASVAAVYSELVNLSESGGGGNRSGGSGNSSQALNISRYPSESNATLEVRGWWSTLCGSTQFTGLIQQWGAGNFTWTTDLGSSGVFWQFEEWWSSSCTIPSVGSFGGCQYAEGWTGSLETGNLTGPVTTASPPCGETKCPVYVLPGKPSPPPPSPYGPWLSFLKEYGIVIGLAAAAAVATVLVVRSRGPLGTAKEGEGPGAEARPSDENQSPDPLEDAI